MMALERAASYGTTQSEWSRVAELAGRRNILGYDPWFDLGRRSGLRVLVHPAGLFHDGLAVTGLSIFGQNLILLDGTQPSWQIRSTLAHELIHFERGPFTAGQLRDEERTVELVTAKRTIDPVVFDALLDMGGIDRTLKPSARWGDLGAARLLGADTSTIEVYARWRRRVSRATALRAWAAERDQEAAAWPPDWMRRHSSGVAELAR